jgi:hypothetical protein
MNLCFLTSVSGLQINNDFIQDKHPASSTTKTGRHDILVAEILLKVVLKHQISNQSIKINIYIYYNQFGRFLNALSKCNFIK